MKQIIQRSLVAAALLFGIDLHAGTHTWTGGSTSGFWSVGSNWENNDPPFASESPLHLVFPSNAARRLSTNNIARIGIDSILFSGAPYTIAASGVGTNVTVNSSVGHSYWNVRATNGTSHTIHSSMNLRLSGTMELNIATNCGVVLRSSLSAAKPDSGLSKDGPGSTVLSPIEDNTFDGVTTVLDGTLSLQGSHTVVGVKVSDITVPGALIIGSASPKSQPRVVGFYADQIADDSSVTVHPNGELDLADVDETIGSLTLIGGFVDTLNGRLTLNGNISVLPASSSVSQIAGHLDLGPIGRFFNVASNASLYVDAVISGGHFGNVPAGVNKLGLGWMSLGSAANTFGGELYVSAGTVSIARAKQLGAVTNTTTVGTGGTLVLGGVGTGPTVDGKTLNLQANARLQAGLDSSWNGPVKLYGKAVLDVPANVVLELGGVLSGVGGFTKTGSGELLLSGLNNNTYTGQTCVDDGQLSLSKVGLFTNAISISGPLIIGETSDIKSPRTVLYANETIAPNVSVAVNRNGLLNLANHIQTIHTLKINSGIADSGILGVIHLGSILTSTNELGHNGQILGWLDLGNAPRTFQVSNGAGWLDIYARITGGTAATLQKVGDGRVTFLGSNLYEGLTQISEGWIEVDHPMGLGSPVNGTVVSDWGALYLSSLQWIENSMTITNETLTLAPLSNDFDHYNGCFASFGTNIWKGVITLGSYVIVRAEEKTDQLILSTRIQGSFGLTKTGKGQLVYSGTGFSSFNNTYSGITRVTDGELWLKKQDALLSNTALAGDLVVTPYGPNSTPIVRVQGRQQFAGNHAVTVDLGGKLLIESPNVNSIGSLTGNGIVQFLPGTRVVTGLNNQSTTFSGNLQGGGINDTNLSMQGNGIFTLNGVNTLSGIVEVTGGTLRIDSAQPSARVEAKFQGTLGGIGSVKTVTMRGGYLAPGSPLGKFHAASFVPAASHWMQFQLNGPALGSGYDQFEVDTTPNLSGAILGTSFGNGFNPNFGQQFLILRNNSALPVAAPFLSAGEGATFYVDDAHRVQITYLGGDGNDVVLTVIAGPAQLKGISINGNRATINGCGTPGATYHIEVTETVEDPASWTRIGSINAGPDGLMQYIDADLQNHAHRFFRFVAP